MVHIWSTETHPCIPLLIHPSVLRCLHHQSDEEPVPSLLQFLGRSQTLSTSYLCVMCDSNPRSMSPKYVTIVQKSPCGFLEAVCPGQVLEGTGGWEGDSQQNNLPTNPIRKILALPSPPLWSFDTSRSLDPWITIYSCKPV